MRSSNISESISIDSLVQKELFIPEYQRPYKWTITQTEQLLNDIREASAKPSIIYVLGSIIVDQSEGKIFIVDGQQRLTTISIILYLINPGNASGFLFNQEFKHLHSKKNIIENANFIKKWFSLKNIDLELFESFLRSKVWFVVINAPSIDDAFTFFDSQNSRGKTLSDYNILKAHHLRYTIKDLAVTCSRDWDYIDKQNVLTYLLQNLTGRIRTLARNDFGGVRIKMEFKAQRMSQGSDYQLNKYIQAPLFTSWQYNLTTKTLDYTLNKDSNPKLEDNLLKFAYSPHLMPLQLTRSVEGGEQFFWYTKKYYEMRQMLFNSDNAPGVYKQLYDYLKRFDNRGMSHLLEIFEAAMMFYFDKFGLYNLDEFAHWLEHLLFYKRLEMSLIKYETVNNYLKKCNVISIIEEASIPEFIFDKIERFTEELYARESIAKFNLNSGIRHLYNGIFYGANGYYRALNGDRFQRVLRAKSSMLN